MIVLRVIKTVINPIQDVLSTNKVAAAVLSEFSVGFILSFQVSTLFECLQFCIDYLLNIRFEVFAQSLDKITKNDDVYTAW